MVAAAIIRPNSPDMTLRGEGARKSHRPIKELYRARSWAICLKRGGQVSIVANVVT